MLSSSTIFRRQHEYTSTWARGCNGGSILQNEAWRLPIAVAKRPDSLLRGYLGGCERQRLQQVQGGQVQVRGPRWYLTCARRRRRLRFHRSHPRHPAGRGRRAAPGEDEPPPAPSPAAKGGGGKGWAGGGGKKASGKASGWCQLN